VDDQSDATTPPRKTETTSFGYLFAPMFKYRWMWRSCVGVGMTAIALIESDYYLRDSPFPIVMQNFGTTPHDHDKPRMGIDATSTWTVNDDRIFFS
jgi:hypothetical protein